MSSEKPGYRRVLGVASYHAVPSIDGGMIELTATGMLPCDNYRAALEKRPEKIYPPMWDMAFYVANFCVKKLRPFSIKAEFPNHGGFDSVVVFDAVGQHTIPLAHSLKAVPLSEGDVGIDQFEVYALLQPSDAEQPQPYVGCIIVPMGSILPAIYFKVFGPMPKIECEAFVTKNCAGLDRAAKLAGDTLPFPWKLAEDA